MFSEHTKQVLAARGYISPYGRTDRRQIARNLVRDLEAHHVVANLEDEAEVAKVATVDELCVALFGESNAELRSIVVAATGSLGPVQMNLANGYLLCSTRVERRVGDVDGMPVYRRFSARLLSGNPVVVRELVLERAVERIARDASRTNAVIDLTERRIPALVGVRAQLALAAMDTVRAALPATG